MSTPKTAIPSSQAMATITAAARIMYPYDALPDDIYARVSEKLAEVARVDSRVARTVQDGVAALNSGQPFGELPADEQLKILKGSQGSDFFDAFDVVIRRCRATGTPASPGISAGARFGWHVPGTC
jgi:hypothetical protein